MKVFIVLNHICEDTLIISVHRTRESAVKRIESERNDLIYHPEDLDEYGSGTSEYWEVPGSFGQEDYMIEEQDVMDQL